MAATWQSGPVKHPGGEGLSGLPLNTTQWDLVFDASAPSGVSPRTDRAALALDALCRIYRPAVVAYIRNRLRNVEDVEDLTQEFFAKFSDGTLLRSAEPKKGLFRALLLTALKRFLLDRAAKSNAKKRGGGVSFVPIDEVKDVSLLDPTGDDTSGDLVFDLCWAETIVERALEKVRGRYEAKGEAMTFEVIRPFLQQAAAGADLAAARRRLNVSENTFHVRVHRFRSLFARFVREELARTVDSPHEIRMELQYLLKVLAASP